MSGHRAALHVPVGRRLLCSNTTTGCLQSPRRTCLRSWWALGWVGVTLQYDHLTLPLNPLLPAQPCGPWAGPTWACLASPPSSPSSTAARYARGGCVLSWGSAALAALVFATWVHPAHPLRLLHGAQKGAVSSAGWAARGRGLVTLVALVCATLLPLSNCCSVSLRCWLHPLAAAAAAAVLFCASHSAFGQTKTLLDAPLPCLLPLQARKNPPPVAQAYPQGALAGWGNTAWMGSSVR